MNDLPQLEEVPVNDAVVGINARWVAPNRYIDHEKMIGLVLECRGTRSYGSAAIEIAYVASGRLDAYISMRLSPWDIAGGMVIAQRGRCDYNKFKRRPVTYSWTRLVYYRTSAIA